MVLTRVKWLHVVLMTAVGAHCARTGTVGGAEQRCGRGCGLLWPQWRRSGWLRKEFVVSDAVEGISRREPVQQRTSEQIENEPQISGRVSPCGGVGAA